MNCKKKYKERRKFPDPANWTELETAMREMQRRDNGLYVFFTKDNGKSLSPDFPETRLRRGTVTFIISDTSNLKLIQGFVWNATDEITPLKIKNEKEFLGLLYKFNIPHVIHRIWSWGNLSSKKVIEKIPPIHSVKIIKTIFQVIFQTFLLVISALGEILLILNILFSIFTPAQKNRRYKKEARWDSWNNKWRDAETGRILKRKKKPGFKDYL